ncbi:MAG: hypothetical protein KF883_13980 [Thermomicrobiales bacterium]|jgi:hypothetical protein|nr:hypothetical protein [Thermomicrobiales bacterium]
MNIAIGRRRLVINVIAEQAESIADRFPSSVTATDKELASIEARRLAKYDRNRWESNAALYGIGHPR